MKNGLKNNHRKKATPRRLIKRLCEWDATCAQTAEWHAVEYCLDYCYFHKEQEIDQHKKAGIPLPSWEKIKHPEFAKLLPPHGPITKRPIERLQEATKNRHFVPLIHTSNVVPPIPKEEYTTTKVVPIEIADVLLGEFVCSGCLNSAYRPIFAVGIEKYPDLEKLEQFLKSKRIDIPSRHVAPIILADHELPEGYAFCGEYKLVKLWREWEDPKRHGEQNEV